MGLLDTATLNMSGPLTCYKCGVVFTMPRHLNETLRENGESFWCPNGHSQAYVESTADKLRMRLEAQVKKTNEWRESYYSEQERAEAIDRSRSAVRGVLTKTRKRVAKGVCPCCNRQFADLHRHMQSKHPDYEETS